MTKNVAFIYEAIEKKFFLKVLKYYFQICSKAPKMILEKTTTLAWGTELKGEGVRGG